MLFHLETLNILYVHDDGDFEASWNETHKARDLAIAASEAGTDPGGIYWDVFEEAIVTLEGWNESDPDENNHD